MVLTAQGVGHPKVHHDLVKTKIMHADAWAGNGIGDERKKQPGQDKAQLKTSAMETGDRGCKVGDDAGVQARPAKTSTWQVPSASVARFRVDGQFPSSLVRGS
jgi:hypothetical protein